MPSVRVIELNDRRTSQAAAPSREAVRPRGVERTRRVPPERIVVRRARLVHADHAITVVVQVIELAVDRVRLPTHCRQVLLHSVLLGAQVTDHHVTELRRVLCLRCSVRTCKQLGVKTTARHHRTLTSDLVHKRPPSVGCGHVAVDGLRAAGLPVRSDVVNTIGAGGIGQLNCIAGRSISTDTCLPVSLGALVAATSLLDKSRFAQAHIVSR